LARSPDHFLRRLSVALCYLLSIAGLDIRLDILSSGSAKGFLLSRESPAQRVVAPTSGRHSRRPPEPCGNSVHMASDHARRRQAAVTQSRRCCYQGV